MVEANRYVVVSCLQADAVLLVHNPSQVHSLSVQNLTCKLLLHDTPSTSANNAFPVEAPLFYLGTLISSDDDLLVFKPGHKKHKQTTRLVEVSHTCFCDTADEGSPESEFVVVPSPSHINRVLCSI